MQQEPNTSRRAGVTRIGIFIDGGYFTHVSSFYRFHHEVGGYLSLNGLKEYIRDRIAKAEGSDISCCRIVDAHYFRGRLPARELQERNALYGERLFDDVLLYSGFERHHQPVSQGRERGIDVMFALEAFHCASSKGLDVCVLVAGDGDFIPLVRKLHGLGTRVMVLGFHVQAVGSNGEPVTTRCSFHLLQEATYPLMVSEEINSTPPGTDPFLDGLVMPVQDKDLSAGASDFTPTKNGESVPASASSVTEDTPASGGDEHRWSGHICHLQDSYGFLLREGDDKRFFFHQSDLVGVLYDDLRDGLALSFAASSNERGPCAKRIRLG